MQKAAQSLFISVQPGVLWMTKQQRNSFRIFVTLFVWILAVRFGLGLLCVVVSGVYGADVHWLVRVLCHSETNITGDSVGALVSGCPTLDALSVYGCAKVTSLTLSRVRIW